MNVKSYRLNIDHVCRSTINQNLFSLSAALTEAVKLGYIEKRPKIEFFKLDEAIPRYLTQEQQLELLRRCPPFSKIERFVRIALQAGLRRAEILGLTWDDVDLVNGWLIVRGTKARRDRRVALHPQLQQYLMLVPREGAQVVGLSKYAVERWFERRAGCTPHTLRHTFASWFIMSSGDVIALKETLGHVQLKHTMLYAHLAPEHSKREIAKLPCLPLNSAPDTISLAEARRQQVATEG